MLRFGGCCGVFTVSKRDGAGISAPVVVRRRLALTFMSFPTPPSLSGVIVEGLFIFSGRDPVAISAFLAW